jgi:glycosyltransferase involved in cell wall biosynthesis
MLSLVWRKIKSNIMNKKFIIYGIGDGVKSQPYLNKLCSILKLSGEVSFYHWRRKSKFKKIVDAENSIDKMIFHAGKWNSKAIFLFYPVWMAIVFFHALVKSKSADMIFCSKFESSLPLAVLSLFINVKYVYLDRDNIAFSYKWPVRLRNILLKLESFIGRNAELHLVPGHSRVYEHRKNIRVVENTPSKLLMDAALKIDASRFLENLGGNKIVYINGWLSDSRGFGTILKACALIERDDSVTFVFAGSGSDDQISEIKEAKNCRYLGHLSNQESLALYFKVTCVVSLFDPSVEIHQRAEPNKWYDCIFTGTPIIVNREIEAANGFIKNHGFLAVDFGDAQGLADMISKLSDRQEFQGKVAEPNGFDYWDVKMTGVLTELL